MEHRLSFAGHARRVSRRFTTIEGWRDVGNGIYALRRTGIQFITTDALFDLERYDDDGQIPTRASKSSMASSSFYGKPDRYTGSMTQNPENPFDDAYITGEGPDPEKINPFDDSNAVFPDVEARNDPVAEPEPPYHIFSKRRKWLLVAIIGTAGLFSGLSSNIYFPSLDLIAKDLQVDLNAVSLTITSYLIIQGISPLIWGSLSDAVGRRPIYLASFSVYIIANIALSFSPSFAVLLVFRGLQAAGSASTVSIGNGVIQDVSPPSERGGFISFYQAIRNFSIAMGPVLGGLLANSLGFRSVFVFLLILSSLVLIMIIFVLPETLRSIAGNGSLRLGGIYQPLIHKFGGEPAYLRDPEMPASRKKVTFMTFVEPLKLLLEKDILFSLLFGGVVYAIWSMVTSSTTGLFKSLFGLSEVFLGLAFLPNGLGTIVGSAVIGKLMTLDYKDTEAAYKEARGLAPDHVLPAKALPADFPIERARLRHLPWITCLFAASTAAYGFSLASPSLTSLRGWIAVPLALQFLIAAASNAIFALNQTFVSDLCPGRGASSTAINNLVRCGLGAIGVAFIETMIAGVGPGPAFLGLALVTVICVPLAVVNWVWGKEWRVSRMERIARAAGTIEKI